MIPLQDIPGLWRGTQHRHWSTRTTGIAALDQLLLGGWPVGALSQLVSNQPGQGLRLLLPTLAALTRQGQTVALIGPPWIPYAPALHQAGVDLTRMLWVEPTGRERIWATEQLLRAGAAALLWSAELEDAAARRLQLAAETEKTLAISFVAATQSNVPAVRLRLRSRHPGLSVSVERCRGARPGREIQLAA